jgi:hypothetical protein
MSRGGLTRTTTSRWPAGTSMPGTTTWLHQVGPDQDGLFDFYERRVSSVLP